MILKLQTLLVQNRETNLCHLAFVFLYGKKASRLDNTYIVVMPPTHNRMEIWLNPSIADGHDTVRFYFWVVCDWLIEQQPSKVMDI